MSTVRKVPLRKCIGCNEMKNKKEMIRVVKTTEGTIIPDTTGRMNGRGAYVCSLECLGKAMKNKGLSRSLKAEIPSEVYEQLKEAFAKIEQSICDRAGRKERQRIPCHSGGNGVGQYTEEISQYVCIL